MQAKIKAIQDRYNKFQNYQIKVSSDVTLYSDLKTQLLYKDFPELLAAYREAWANIDMVVSCFKLSEENLHRVQKEIGYMMHDAREAKERERGLRTALEKIINFYNIPQNDLKNHVGDMMCQIARVALGQEAKA
jgi:hypothetical protein